MLFEDETNEWKPMSPRPRRGLVWCHPTALVALLALTGAVGAALVGLGTLYASELEPCLRTDGGTFGNCGDATGAFVVATVVGIPALVWLLAIVLRHRHSKSVPCGAVVPPPPCGPQRRSPDRATADARAVAADPVRPGHHHSCNARVATVDDGSRLLGGGAVHKGLLFRGGTALVGLLMVMLLGGCALPFAAGEVELTDAEDWRLVVTRSQELAVVSANGRSGAGDFTQPPTLNEAGAYFLDRDGRPVTVVAGPVDGEATGVLVRTVEGTQSEAQVVEAFGMTWFWTELPGEVRPAELVATDAKERIVDEFTLPPMPGPAPAPESSPPA